MPGRVYTVKPTGDLTFAHVRLGADTAAMNVDPQLRLEADRPAGIELDGPRLRLIDGETGRRLTSGYPDEDRPPRDGNVPWVLMRIETDAGVTGLGEAYRGAGVAELVHEAEPLVEGQDPCDIDRIIEMMVRCLSGEGSQAGATATAISGVEIALWDLVARSLGAPIHTLFGGRFRDRIRIDADGHAGETSDPADNARKAREAVAEGFTAIKFDFDTPEPHATDVSEDTHPWRQWYEPFDRTIGSMERRWMVEVARAAREGVGPAPLPPLREDARPEHEEWLAREVRRP